MIYKIDLQFSGDGGTGVPRRGRTFVHRRNA